MHIGFLWGNLRETDHFEDPDTGGKKIVRWIFRQWGWGVWIELAQDRDRWQVNTITR